MHSVDETGSAAPQARLAVEPPAECVMVVEADAILRESIAGSLLRAGFHVLGQTESLEEASRLLRKLEVDLVVVGDAAASTQLLDSLRTLRHQRKPALVLLTPIPEVAWIRQARAHGCDALLGRPPREGDLLAAVENALARLRERRELQHQVDALRDRMETAAMVQRAKEVLMRKDRISDHEAYQRLRRQSERSGRPLRNIAEAVLLASRVAPMA